MILMVRIPWMVAGAALRHPDSRSPELGRGWLLGHFKARVVVSVRADPNIHISGDSYDYDNDHGYGPWPDAIMQ